MLDADPQTRFQLGLGFALLWFAQWTISFLLFKYRVSNEAKDLITRDHDKTGSPILGAVIRQWFFEQLRPFEDTFVRWKITPNMLTVTGLVLSCLTGFFYHLGWVGAAGWLLCFTGSFDILDGVIARKTGLSSKSGAYFDSVLDRYGEMIVYAGLLSLYMRAESYVMFWMVFAGIIGAQMVSYTKARAEVDGVNAKVGIMQRPERLVCLGLGSLFSSFFNAMLAPWLEQRQYLLATVIIFIAVMTNVTAYLRFRYSFEALKKA